MFIEGVPGFNGQSAPVRFIDKNKRKVLYKYRSI